MIRTVTGFPFLLLAACTIGSNDVGVATDIVTKESAVISRITVNGNNADVILFAEGPDGQSNGFLNASENRSNQNARTYALEFGYSDPLPGGAGLLIYQGFGAIPAGAYSQTNNQSNNQATLNVTTDESFTINRCEVDNEGGFSCANYPGSLSFALTWTQTAFGQITETVNRTEVFGPFITKFKGTSTSFTAQVNGTWAGHDAYELSGNLRTTDSRGYTRTTELQ